MNWFTNLKFRTPRSFFRLKPCLSPLYPIFIVRNRVKSDASKPITRLVVPEHFHVALEIHEHEQVLQAADGAVVDGRHPGKVLPEVAQPERRRH